MFGKSLGNPEDIRPGVSAGRQGAATHPVRSFGNQKRFLGNPLCPIGRDRQVPANLMARAMQRFSVRTAIPVGLSAPLLVIGLALALVLVQGSKLRANFVLRLSLDSSDDLPLEKTA